MERGSSIRIWVPKEVVEALLAEAVRMTNKRGRPVPMSAVARQWLTERSAENKEVANG